MKPCVICCAPVSNPTVSRASKEEDFKVFKWFLINLQFPTGQILFSGWAKGGWDGQGGGSGPLPICKVCKVPLVEWIGGSSLERNKEISFEIPRIRRRMVACEMEFEKSGIYQKDPRYWNVRRNVIKVMIVKEAGEPQPKKIKTSFGDQVIGSLSAGGNEEVEVQVKEEVISEDENILLGPSAGAWQVEDDNKLQHCLLCYKAIKESELSPVLTNDKVEANLNVVFVLRKMLNVPSLKLQDYLKKYGCPDKWVKYCRKCLCLVDKALRIQKEISKLENKLRECQAKMKEEIKANFQVNKKSTISMYPNQDVTQITEETREYVISSMPLSPGKLELVEAVPLVTNDPLEESPTGSFQLVANDPLEEFPSPAQSSDDDNPEKLNSLSLDKILDQGNYKCPSCPFLETMTLSQFYSHVIFHKKRPFKCSTCNLYWSSPTELEKNPFATQVPLNPEHLCSQSTLVINTDGKFNPGDIWNCSWCSTKFNCEFKRHHHEIEHHSEDYQKLQLNYPCLPCQSQNERNKYRSYEEWLLHRVLEHTEIALTSCLYCEETMKIQTNKGIDILHTADMQSHVLRHHPSFKTLGYPDFCDFCGKTCDSGPGPGQNLLVDHIQNYHGLAPQQTYSCPICHYRCDGLKEFRDHLLSNHPVAVAGSKKVRKKKQVVCDICGKKIGKTAAVHLIDHKMVQHGIEPEEKDGKFEILNCERDGCGYRTLISWRLKDHMMKKHGAQRSCICEQCGKGFTDSTKLKVHQEIHENQKVKPYQCEVCGNSFAVKNYLYIHMRLSHQNRPFASTNKKKSNKRAEKTGNQGTDNLSLEDSKKTG